MPHLFETNIEVKRCLMLFLELIKLLIDSFFGTMLRRLKLSINICIDTKKIYVNNVIQFYPCIAISLNGLPVNNSTNIIYLFILSADNKSYLIHSTNGYKCKMHQVRFFVKTELIDIILGELMVIILAELIFIVGKDNVINNLAVDENVLPTDVDISDLSADAYKYLLPPAILIAKN